MAAEASNETIHQASARDGSSWFELEAYRDLLVRVKFGPGRPKVARACLQAFDHILEIGGEGGQMKLLADVKGVRFAGLRVEIMFGRWFIKNRHRVARIAIVGAGRAQAAIVGAIMKIAGFERIRYFLDEDLAKSWAQHGGLLGPGPQA